ncbi:hypothetical protein EDB87DRAFT_1262216 [Lactarius vividus]|nr:hypothetical protein EDB87DRAFT_1262216 [Lactarius vividus]
MTCQTFGSAMVLSESHWLLALPTWHWLRRKVMDRCMRTRWTTLVGDALLMRYRIMDFLGWRIERFQARVRIGKPEGHLVCVRRRWEARICYMRSTREPSRARVSILNPSLLYDFWLRWQGVFCHPHIFHEDLNYSCYRISCCRICYRPLFALPLLGKNPQMDLHIIYHCIRSASGITSHTSPTRSCCVFSRCINPCCFLVTKSSP